MSKHDRDGLEPLMDGLGAEVALEGPQSAAPTNLSERMRAARRAAGLTQEAAAARVGVSRPAVSQWESGGTAPTAENVARMAAVCGVPPEWLMFGSGPGARRDPRASEIPMRRAAGRRARGPMPVYSSETGPDGTLRFRREPVARLRRPEPLVGVEDAFALVLPDQSMRPVYAPGDLLLVQPCALPRPDDDVLAVFEERAETCAASIGRLVARGAAGVRLRQFHPTRDLTLPRARVLALHRIVGCYRRPG